jgi:hypothetical protein
MRAGALPSRNNSIQDELCCCSNALVSRPVQSGFELLPLLLPTSLLLLPSFFDFGALRFDGRRPPVMLLFGFIERSLRLGDCLLATLALFLPGGLVSATFAFTPPLFPLKRYCGVAS